MSDMEARDYAGMRERAEKVANRRRVFRDLVVHEDQVIDLGDRKLTFPRLSRELANDVLALLADRDSQEARIRELEARLEAFEQYGEKGVHAIRQEVTAAYNTAAYNEQRLAAAEAERVRLREALEDECEMAEQSADALRSLLANWRYMSEESTPDGELFIEEALRSLIDDVTPVQGRAALAPPDTKGEA